MRFLYCQLGDTTIGQELTVKVLDFEHTGSTLGSGSLEFRRVDLDKVLRVEVFSE